MHVLEWLVAAIYHWCLVHCGHGAILDMTKLPLHLLIAIIYSNSTILMSLFHYIDNEL